MSVSEQDRRLRCPACHADVDVPAGQRPRCPHCGYPAKPAAIPPSRGRQERSDADRVRGAAIETHGLGKRYGEQHAVVDLGIRVARGGVVGFVGPNGAGKTTTIRMLMGLVRPSSGHARVLGHDIRDPAAYLPRVGALIESPALYPQLSGRRNLQVLARLGGFPMDRVPQLLEFVGLASRAEDRFKTYSLGMKQRLAIAAALLPDPQLIILDEPTNGLDPAGIREIRELLRRIGASGKTVFVSSHLLAEVQRMCDEIIVIRQGRLVFHGPLDQLLAQQTGIVVAADRPADHVRLADLMRRLGYAVEQQRGDLLVSAPVDQAAALNQAAMKAGIVLRKLRAQEGDLEATVLGMTDADAVATENGPKEAATRGGGA